jgi:hypothetical protein
VLDQIEPSEKPMERIRSGVPDVGPVESSLSCPQPAIHLFDVEIAGKRARELDDLHHLLRESYRA